MKKILLSACCTLFLLVGIAQTDAERLQKLDQYIEQARQQWDSPGLGVTIVKDGDEPTLARGAYSDDFPLGCAGSGAGIGSFWVYFCED